MGSPKIRSTSRSPTTEFRGYGFVPCDSRRVIPSSLEFSPERNDFLSMLDTFPFWFNILTP